MTTPPPGTTGWYPAGPPEPPRKNWARRLAVALAAGALAIITGAIIIGGLSGSSTPATHTPPTAVPTYNSYTQQAAAPVATQPAAPTYTVPQQQAIAAAQSYLSDGQGFSKLGLIHQLDSRFGDGFSRSLARFAVAHITVSWKHQAVVSARGYMQSQPGWSYSSLVQQLSSPYGENFTLSQAEYAASKVGL